MSVRIGTYIEPGHDAVNDIDGICGKFTAACMTLAV